MTGFVTVESSTHSVSIANSFTEESTSGVEFQTKILKVNLYLQMNVPMDAIAKIEGSVRCCCCHSLNTPEKL